MADKVLDFLSGYGVSLRRQKLPDSVVHAVKRHLIDTLGCAMGAYHMQPPAIARAHALETQATPGSTVLGTLHRSAPELAAFANGVATRYLDLNDAARRGNSGHPSDNFAAVLAAAEYAGSDMSSTIAGIVMAYEVQNRIGAVCGDVRANGWDHAAFVVIAAAAGSAVAMGLDKVQTANAIALAIVPNAPMGQTRVGQLSMWKGCTAPNAARNGVFAALMARRGMTGPDEPFEGRRGYKKQLGSSFELPGFGGNGVAFAMGNDKLKYYPCTYDSQCSITPAIEMYKTLNGNVAQIESVDIETYDHAVQVSADRDKWNPTNRETADHSIPYVVAVALTRGTVWLDDFTEARFRDPQILALMQKISVRATEECNRAYPEAFPYRITVTTKSGARHVQEIRYAKGHPKNPLSDAEICTKFRKLAEPVMGPARTELALNGLWRLEEMKEPREIFTLFALTADR